MKKLIRTSLFLLSLLLVSSKKDFTNTIIFKPFTGSGLNDVELVTDKNGRLMYRLVDNTYIGKSSPRISDLVLSFNTPSDKIKNDDTGKYRIRYSRYKFSQSEKEIGQGAALFMNSEQRVEISTAENLWLGRCGDLGSFSIEFRFKPLSLKNGSILFSRIGYFSGKKRGVRIIIRNSRIVALLDDLFRMNNGLRRSCVLSHGVKIEKGKWYHYVLSYDRLSGKLASHINGEEDESFYMTEDGSPYNNVNIPVFGLINDDESFRCTDSVNAVIGRNYIGYIDEFRIMYADINRLYKNSEIYNRKFRKSGMIKRVPVNYEGVITSPVYSFPSTGTKITLFNWNEILEKNTFIWFEIRIYDRLFDGNNTELSWYTVDNKQRGIYLAKNSAGNYMRGKYYQWRAHLIASPDGKKSPYLYDVGLNYILDTSPAVPGNLEVTETGDGYIILRWMKNNDLDILGYRIYYGAKPDRYDGILSYYKGKRITNKMNSGNSLKIVIDNSLIDKNKKSDRRNFLTYPKIVNNVLYYFSVSAYDDYRPDTPFNHESGLSNQVSGRPFHGSEIRNN